MLICHLYCLASLYCVYATLAAFITDLLKKNLGYKTISIFVQVGSGGVD